MTAEFVCPDGEDLERLLLGDMSDIEMEILEGHVAGCTRCLAVIRTLPMEDGLVAVVRAGGKSRRLPLNDVDTALIARVCQQVLPSRAATFSNADSAATLDGLASILEPGAAADEMGRIGDYGVLRILGSGSMGIVCAARQDRPRRVVALKMLVADPRGNRQRLERFRGESEILARLRHPHIVQVHEVGEHRGRAYFAMEYAEGGSLARQLAAAPVPAHDAARLTETLARTMHAAHVQGVVHRDLKPSNVLLTVDGTPKIGDFGLAKHLDGETPAAQTETGAILGTPGYMAPEQAAGQNRAVGPAADVYALGAILYECLTGRPPFRAATVLETLQQAHTQEPVPPARLQPNVPRDLQTICLKCLAKEPQRRYGSALALAEDLERFLAGQPIVARPARMWERLWKWARRQPAAAALVVLGILVIAGTIAGVLTANAKLQHAADEARRGHEIADARYRAARDALGRMLNLLKDPKLADVPRLQELRLNQLEYALAYYQAALAETDDADPVIRRDAAFAYTETGAIQSLLGQPDKANEQFRRAIALITQLPAEEREQSECRAQLAVCYGHVGAHAYGAGNVDEAEKHHRIEHDLYVRLCEEHPADPGRQDNLASAEHHLGNVYMRANRLPEARTHLVRAVEIRTPLVRDHPEIADYQIRLAETLMGLGVLNALMGQKQESRTAGEKAIALLEPLVERHPENLQWALSLAGAYGNAGNQLKDDGKNREALKPLDRAVALAEAALQREPRQHVAQERAFTVHGVRAQVFDSLGDWPAAVKDWDRVVELDRFPNAWVRRLFRAVDLARAKYHARAVAEAEALAQDPKLLDAAAFALVRLYALALAAVLEDTRLMPAEQSRLAEDYTVRAVALLQHLQARGFFREAGNRQELEFEPELRALRGRADFQQLLKQVLTEKK